MREVKGASVPDFALWLETAMRRTVWPVWLQENGAERDVVLSSRSRTMRNFSGYVFPSHLSDIGASEVLDKFRNVMSFCSIFAGFEERSWVSEVERALLVGGRLVSQDLQWNRQGRSVFLSGDGGVGVMVNEEDHLRISVVGPGYCVRESLSRLESMEQTIEEHIPMSIHPEFGYLAASPLNCGNGRRVGSMLHLIGIAEQGEIPVVRSVLDEFGFEARGLLGEHSAGTGGYVQISSNGLSLELEGVIGHLIHKERSCRNQMGKNLVLEKVQGVRSRCMSEDSLNFEQSVQCVSWLRLGAAFDLIGQSVRELDALLTLLSFGHFDEPLTNSRRAQVLRSFLALPAETEGTEPIMSCGLCEVDSLSEGGRESV